ncbi:MAG: hypothetical protein JNJ60_00665 [Rhodocyclaceae bacterium]|nr:hypothetical protein [Rhodocyclaceae bacterium]
MGRLVRIALYILLSLSYLGGSVHADNAAEGGASAKPDSRAPQTSGREDLPTSAESTADKGDLFAAPSAKSCPSGCFFSPRCNGGGKEICCKASNPYEKCRTP